MIYELVNTQNNVVNRIEWDGVTPYTPEEGLTLREVPEAETPAEDAQE